MVAIAVILSAVVSLLAVLVAGLLRSHADILKALHDLGVGVGEPTGDGSHDGAVHRHGADVAGEGAGRPGPVRGPFTMGPPLPSERHVESAPTVSGVTPGGKRALVSPGAPRRIGVPGPPLRLKLTAPSSAGTASKRPMICSWEYAGSDVYVTCRLLLSGVPLTVTMTRSGTVDVRSKPSWSM